MPNIINYGNPVPLRNPHRRNVEAFTNALNKIDEKAKESLQTQNQIQMALANLDINAAEDSWKAGYIRNIQNQLDDAAMYGDYSRSLNTARELAGQVASDPAVLGRVRAQAAYKTFMDNLDKRQDITQDVKNWAKDNNPYHYQDQIDKEGHIIGGTNWEPNRTPVSTVDLSNLMSKAKQWVAVHKGSGVSDIKFVDADGNLTSDPGKNVYGLAYKKSGSWEYVSEKDLNDALKSAIDTTPGARASLQQDYEVALWKYNKMTPEEKKKNIDSDITENGLLLNPEEYLAKRVKPGIHAMSYYNSSSDIEVGSGQSNYTAAAATKAASGSSSGGTSIGNEDIEQGLPIEKDGAEIASNNYKNLSDTIQSLHKLFPNLSKTNAFNNGVTGRRYEELARLCTRNIKSKDPLVRSQAFKAIRQLRDYGRIYNNYMETVPKSQRDAVAFNTALEAGAPLPNNSYTHEYNQQINDLFKNTDVKPGKVHSMMPYNTIGYLCKDDEAYNTIARNLGVSNRNDWKRFGFNVVNINGDIIITFNKNNRNITKLSNAAMQSRTGIGHLWGEFAGTSGIVTFSNGKVSRVNNKKTDEFFDMGNLDVPGIDAFSSKPAMSAKIITTNINKGRNMNKTLNTMTLFSDNIRNLQLKNDYLAGRMDKQHYDVLSKQYEKEDENIYNDRGSMMNGRMYANDDEGKGSLKVVQEDGKSELIDLIQIAGKDKRLRIRQSIDPLSGRYGTYFDIAADDKHKPRTIFVEGMGQSEAANRYQNDTLTRGRALLHRTAVLNGQFSLANGAKIEAINPNAGTAIIKFTNGKSRKVSFDEAVRYAGVELARQDIKDRLVAGDIRNQEELTNLIAGSLKDQGREYNVNNANEELAIIYNNY